MDLDHQKHFSRNLKNKFKNPHEKVRRCEQRVESRTGPALPGACTHTARTTQKAWRLCRNGQSTEQNVTETDSSQEDLARHKVTLVISEGREATSREEQKLYTAAPTLRAHQTAEPLRHHRCLAECVPDSRTTVPTVVSSPGRCGEALTEAGLVVGVHI